MVKLVMYYINVSTVRGKGKAGGFPPLHQRNQSGVKMENIWINHVATLMQDFIEGNLGLLYR